MKLPSRDRTANGKARRHAAGKGNNPGTLSAIQSVGRSIKKLADIIINMSMHQIDLDFDRLGLRLPPPLFMVESFESGEEPLPVVRRRIAFPVLGDEL